MSKNVHSRSRRYERTPLQRGCCERRPFFFFQAEDGIRDWSVTGVQTCALPISRKRPADLEPGENARKRRGYEDLADVGQAAQVVIAADHAQGVRHRKKSGMRVERDRDRKSVV